MSIRPSASQAPHSPYAGHKAHLTDYLRVLYKRRWTAGLALLVVFVLGAFDTLKKTPIYVASTELLIEKEARRASSLNSVLEQQDTYYEDEFYQTQHRILQSRTLAWHAIEQLGLHQPAANTPGGQTAPAPIAEASPSWSSRFGGWIASVIGAPKKIDPPAADETTTQSVLIDQFLGGLRVEQIRNTHLVKLWYSSPDPVFAARAANAVARQYKEQSLEARFVASKDTSDWFGQELEEQRKKVEASDAALQNYKEKNNAVALDDRQQNTVITRLADLGAQVTRATGERIDKQATYNRLVILQEQKDRDALESFPAVMSSEVIQKLKADLRQLNNERAPLVLKFGANYPEVKTNQTRIDTTNAKLQIEIDKIIEAVRNDFLTAEAREVALTKAMNEQKTEALNMQGKGIAYAALEREAISNRQLYETLLQKTKETGVASQFRGSRIEIVDAAEVPRLPALPNTRRDLFFAFLGGCVMAIGLAFGFEYLDSRIKTPDELRAHLGLPFLGLVPTISLKGRPDEVLLLQSDVPASFAEAVRAVRTAIIFSSAEEGARAVVITSTAPSEGKTLVSSNLAVALAQAGQRTLIIDGDMRRPRIHTIFGRAQEPGLSNVLVGTARIRDAVRNTTVPNLSILPAGHIPPNPAELLGSTRYLETLDELRQQFEWILIDAPPVMAVTDAAVLSHSATGVVFVVGAEMTSRRNAFSAIEQLAAARAKFIGAVLNKVNLERHSYYYSPYYRKDYTKAYERTTKP